jgi:hypothetical protein
MSKIPGILSENQIVIHWIKPKNGEYIVNPITSIEEIVSHWHISEDEWASAYAFFLYADEDKNIARYVRENFFELNRLSGEKCLIFLIENPPKSQLDEARAREYWREFEFKTPIWPGFTKVMPYNQSTAHEIGRYLGIHQTDVPCITFFRSIHDSQLVIYRLDNSWTDLKLTEELRELFSSKDWEWKSRASFARREEQWRWESRVAVHPLAKTVEDTFKEILDRLPDILRLGAGG